MAMTKTCVCDRCGHKVTVEKKQVGEHSFAWISPFKSLPLPIGSGKYNNFFMREIDICPDCELELGSLITSFFMCINTETLKYEAKESPNKKIADLRERLEDEERGAVEMADEIEARGNVIAQMKNYNDGLMAAIEKLEEELERLRDVKEDI